MDFVFLIFRFLSKFQHLRTWFSCDGFHEMSTTTTYANGLHLLLPILYRPAHVIMHPPSTMQLAFRAWDTQRDGVTEVGRLDTINSLPGSACVAHSFALEVIGARLNG